jgi:hypothetical protein
MNLSVLIGDSMGSYYKPSGSSSSSIMLLLEVSTFWKPLIPRLLMVSYYCKLMKYSFSLKVDVKESQSKVPPLLKMNLSVFKNLDMGFEVLS